jgi:putative spermidine/putrescine transport system ATP-binding protein
MGNGGASNDPGGRNTRKTFAPWSDAAARALVRFDGVSKRFAGIAAVERVSLDIFAGEFFALLGPSGCGKTTLLRLLAGFETPDEGRILLDGEDIARMPPYRRPVNMMFQSYALFPHLSVEGNVAFGLKQERLARSEIATRVEEILALVRLEGFAKRKPHQLSGGQRQRVALARAIANEPEVLLLDEPLGALDLKLRQEMQLELKRIQREVGITFIFVTHDQEEALTMSDRLVVLNGGRIEQLGTPIDVYERPASEFVAGFIGVSNLLEREGRRFTIRPEKVRLAGAGEPAQAGYHAEGGRISDVIYLGMVTRYVVELSAGGTVIAVSQNRETAGADVLKARGREVTVSWREDQTFQVGHQPAAEAPSTEDDQ